MRRALRAAVVAYAALLPSLGYAHEEQLQCNLVKFSGIGQGFSASFTSPTVDAAYKRTKAILYGAGVLLVRGINMQTLKYHSPKYSLICLDGDVTTVTANFQIQTDQCTSGVFTETCVGIKVVGMD